MAKKFKNRKVTPTDDKYKVDHPSSRYNSIDNLFIEEKHEMCKLLPDKNNWNSLVKKVETASKWLNFISKRRLSSSKVRTRKMKNNKKEKEGNFNENASGICPYLDEKHNIKHKNISNHTNNKALVIYFSQMASTDDTDDELDLCFIESLIQNGANINASDKYGQTVFHEVARVWHVDVAKFLLALDANINEADKFGRTPLHVAAAVNYPEMVKFLIDNGADIELCTFGEEQKAIHYAAKNDALDSLHMLWKLGCDMEVVDAKNRTPLHLAAQLDRSETADFLVEHGAEVAVFDCNGFSALTFMVEKMPPVALKALDRYHETDRPNRKQYFHLHLLEGAVLANKSTKTSMEAVTLNKQMNLLLHVVFHRLLQVKWSKFGQRQHIKLLSIQILFVLLWSAFACTNPHNSKAEYSKDVKWWRVALELIAIFLTLFFIVQEIYEWRRSVHELMCWQELRCSELRKDLKYCHPRWPEERKYIILELERIKSTKISYFKDMWNLLDWFAYIWIILGIVFRISALLGDQSAADNHKKILATSMIIIWLRTLKFAKVYHSIGPFIVMLGHILQDTIKFCFLFMEFFIPYTIAFWMLFGGTENASAMTKEGESSAGWKNVNDLIYSVWLITLVGDFDYNAVASIDKIMAQILVGTFSAVSGILMLNLFIALMSETFQRVYENAKANQLMQKAIALNAYQRSLGKKSLHKFMKYLNENCSPEEVYYDDDDTEKSGELEKVTLQIKDVVDDMKQQMDAEIEKNEEVWKAVEEQISIIEKSQKEGIAELSSKVDNLAQIMKDFLKNQSKGTEIPRLQKLPSLYELKPHLFESKEVGDSVAGSIEEEEEVVPSSNNPAVEESNS